MSREATAVHSNTSFEQADCRFCEGTLTTTMDAGHADGEPKAMQQQAGVGAPVAA